MTLMAGTPDIGGSRASMALMAAEELGIDYDKVRPIIADTSSLGYTYLTGGSRVDLRDRHRGRSRRRTTGDHGAVRARRQDLGGRPRTR